MKSVESEVVRVFAAGEAKETVDPEMTVPSVRMEVPIATGYRPTVIVTAGAVFWA